MSNNKLSKFAVPIAVAICLWIGWFALPHLLPEPFDSPFFERDPLHSRVLVHDVGVNQRSLFFLSIGVPALSIALEHFALSARQHRILPSLIRLSYATSVTALLTDSLKRVVGRKRPNFFALCDYKGYRQAIASADEAPSSDDSSLALYFEKTVTGRPGSLRSCGGDARDIREGQLSFPSGHTSIMFAGTTFAFGSLHTRARRRTLGLFLFAPATLVAVSRTRDGWHHYGDVLAGAALGSAVAFMFLPYSVSKKNRQTLPS